MGVLHGNGPTQRIVKGDGAAGGLAVLIFGPIGVQEARAAGYLKRNARKAAAGAVVVGGELDGVRATVGPGVRV